ncbi:MAG: VCBS repeat-containing protein, partial [Deltaproteobacteria bacterium]|nr:VCBS repeat-containing protein [Deltaproteobacteria bacterium]
YSGENSDSLGEISGSPDRNLEFYDELVAANLDGQGTDEFILGDASDDRIHIYTTELTEINSFDVGFERYDDLAAGDLDGDGTPEIILGDASDPGGHSIRIFSQNGDEIGWYQVAGGYERYDRVAAGDLDGDGIDEIVFGDVSTGDDSIHILKWSASASGHITEAHKFFVDYSRKDEIAVGDVNGDGTAEIIYGCGSSFSSNLESRQRITVYDGDGNRLALSADISFSGADSLTAGDVNMDGRDEIIVAKVADRSIRVYKVSADGNFLETANLAGCFHTPNLIPIDDFYDGIKIVVGDVDGGSLTVGDPICRGQSEIDEQLIAVINAPPKHNGINNDPGIFTVSYEHDQTQTLTNTLTAITSFAFSDKIETKMNLVLSKMKVSLSRKFNLKQQQTSQTQVSIQIGEGLVADLADRKYAVTTIFDLFEYPVLDPQGDHLVIDGKPQYLLVSVPVSIGTPTLGYYNSSIHTLGDITSYPHQVSKLTNFSFEPIYDTAFVAGPDPSSAFIKKSESQFNENKASAEIKIALGLEIKGVGGSGKFSGEYGNQLISTHKLEFKENTSLEIDYAGGINDENKYYSAHAYAYYDTVDGHLVLDWLVNSYGSYYTSSLIGDLPWWLNLQPVFTPWLSLNSPLPLPTGQETYDYDDNGQTVRSDDPAACQPLGYEIADNQLNLLLDLPAFADPVDIYVTLYAPEIDPNRFYYVTPDGTTEPLTTHLLPWATFTSGDLNETLISGIPINTLPFGHYYFYLLVAPANQSPLNRYYLWSTVYKKEITINPIPINPH